MEKTNIWSKILKKTRNCFPPCEGGQGDVPQDMIPYAKGIPADGTSP